jgi:hypothetical protein
MFTRQSNFDQSIMVRHFDTEDYITQWIKYTFRNIPYVWILIPQFIGGNTVLEKGILPAGDGKVSFALRRMGEDGKCIN